VPLLAIAFALLISAPAAQAPDPLPPIEALIKDGKYAEAEKAARAALAASESQHGPDSPAAAHALTRLAEALLRQGRADEETQRAIARALAIEERSEPRSRELALAQGNEAWLFEARGDAAAAREWYARMVDTMTGALGPDDRETLLAEKDLAMAWNNLGEYAKARALLEQALATRTRQDPTHVDVSVLRHNLGVTLWQQGDYAAARDAFVAASEGLTRAYGPNHPHVASALEGLAVLQTQLGEHAEARTTYRRVLAIRERVLPAGHHYIGQTYVNLGDALMSMGDNAGALDALTHGLAIWEKALGPDHPQLIVALTDLAVLRDRLGDHARAIATMRRGIAIREKANGKDDATLLIPLTQLANMLADRGRWTEAHEIYVRAKTIGTKTRGADHPDVATAEYEEGTRLAAHGDIAEAGRLIEHARTSRIKAFGDEHPSVADAIDATARIAAARGMAADALDRALQSEAIVRRHFQATAAVLPEQDALLYAEGRERSQDLALFIASRMPNLDARAIERVWDAVTRSRALVLDEMAFRRRLTTAVDTPISREIADAAANARVRLAQLFVRGPSADHPADFPAELARAREETERAEERVARESAPFRRERQMRSVGLEDVKRALPADAALVSFVRYEAGIYSRSARGRRFAYAAFVLAGSHDKEALIPLGDAAAIDALVAQWRQQVREETTAPPMGAAQRETAYRQVAAALRERIWDPLSAHVKGASRILIVPDGALHLVDFATLPIGRDRYLVDAGATLHQATAERDLIPETRAAGHGLLALGSPAFDRATPVANAASASRYRSDCPATPGLRFASLPESGREATAVARLWGTRDGASVVLRGADASEAAIKAQAPGHRVLHLATHAFVSGEGCGGARESAGARGAAALTVASNPMLGSGLVLAGAARRGRSDNQEDGILTAEEISALDLGGIEWAVLSACDSGVGIARAGEGIFGLRRAFQIAGVRTVVASLWPVEDRLARAWMERLYSARLAHGRSTDEAVRDANRATLAERRRSGASTHPLYWSGFVAAGDWR